jgi:hypothetical protein
MIQIIRTAIHRHYNNKEKEKIQEGPSFDQIIIDFLKTGMMMMM